MTPSQLLDLLQAHVDRRITQVVPIAQSSNRIFRADAPHRSYGVRMPNLDERSLSPFWRQLAQVFGHRYETMHTAAPWVARRITGIGGLTAPKPLGTWTINSRVVAVSTWLDGSAWEPDTFPASDAVHHALGDFLGRMHGLAFAGFGAVPGKALRPAAHYSEWAGASVRRLLQANARHPELRERFEAVAARCEAAAVVSAFAPIMPDLSANQFVYRGDSIAGVVDLDAYVIGPIELELTVAEWCVTRPEAFRRGYERHRPLPRFARFRDYHRLTLLANDLDAVDDAGAILNANVHFD